MLGEFDLIREYLRPLAREAPGALGLGDDAALLSLPPGRELVLTADALVSGVHFLPADPPDLVAQKLLRVNLSDLAAMGAEPLGYLVTVTLPAVDTEAWMSAFAAGLARDQQNFGLSLLGGDTTCGGEQVVLSLTALGTVEAGQALRRKGAQAGDRLYVSGTIGDSFLGLKLQQGGLTGLGAEARAALIERYRRPRPRLALGTALARDRLARAAIDVSDGLVADVGHLAAESGLAAAIEAERVPLSPAAQAAVAEDPALLGALLTGGDDYELAFAVRPDAAPAVDRLAAGLSLALTPIGSLRAGQGVTVVDHSGAELPLERRGWSHF
ncbi:MAG: thiamine-phosphate kinase [Kiloniellales bacterium]|nr:thiamine-phosphate kinase [Kiloniellales bacterium]